MLPLNKEYLDILEEIAQEVQASPQLAQYLEEEEETDYGRVKEMFEPRIGLLYDKVSEFDPLQLIAFEQRLLQDDFEGLYLPKILGYSVLRGEINKNYKYVRPQEHFKDVLMAICNSANFDILKKRIGQSIQMGFALSSDIWVTNLITPIENRRIRYFLQGQKLEKYRQIEHRVALYTRYKRQFKEHNFMTAYFPNNMSELKIYWSSLKLFLVYRIQLAVDNKSFLPYIKAFIENPDFKGTTEHLQIMGLYATFFNLEKENMAHLLTHFNDTRQKHPNFIDEWLDFILEWHASPELDLNGKADIRTSSVLDRSQEDDLTHFYDLMEVIHGKGWVHEEAQEAVRVFYNQYQGLSKINECVRKSIFNYIHRLITNLEPRNYHDFFELAKVFTVYMRIFQNQQFNQNVKDYFMAYVRKLLKFYTDKRGKDYQDIKKFVSTTFQDLGFLKEKEVIELFKTRRKRKKPTD